MKTNTATKGFLALAYSGIALASPVGSGKGIFLADLHRNANTSQAVDAHVADKNPKKRTTQGPYHLNHDRAYWYTNITVGGHESTVMFDTGAADLWVTGINVSPLPRPELNRPWDPTKSRYTYKMNRETFTIAYGDGNNGASGSVYFTQACIGEACTYMGVGVADEVNNLSDLIDGSLGMGFSGGNFDSPNQLFTFMESLENVLDDPVFALRLSPYGSDSQVAFGGNPFNFVAPMQKIAAVGNHKAAPDSWAWASDVRVNQNGQLSESFGVIFDTGGPGTTAPEGIIRNYYAGVPGAVDVSDGKVGAIWLVPCGTKLPDFEFVFPNGAIAIIPGRKFYGDRENDQTGTCQLSLGSSGSDSNLAFVGDAFFDQHVVVFNQREATISWGNQN